MNKLILIIFSVIATLSSCDIIEGPYDEQITVDSITRPVRKVLIEDFTGHKCGNCPCAAKEAINLANLYNGRVIVVGTHVTFFATVNQSGKYTYDFRTQTGDELESHFGIQGLPIGFVNRTAYNNSVKLSHTEWSSAINSILDKDGTPGIDTLPPPIIVEIDPSYNSSSRTVTTDINLEYLEAGNNNHSVVLYVVEDSITNWQLFYAQCSPTSVAYDEQNYVHRHVLRGSVNGTWGEQVSANTTIPVGTKITKTYTKVLDPSWNDKHIYLVAFVHDNVTKEVLQVEEIHLK
jgi:thiol-disulfide isomerase/thioredoxin